MLETSEETLRQEFSRFKPGCVERVKKLTDYAFVHYRSRSDALTALSLMNGAQIDGAAVEVTLAKPAGVKDGGAAGRKCGTRGSQGGGGNGGNGTFGLHKNDGGMMGRDPMRLVSLPLTNPFYSGSRGKWGEKIEIFYMFGGFFASYVEVKGRWYDSNQRHKVSGRKNKKIIFNLIGSGYLFFQFPAFLMKPLVGFASITCI